MPPRQRELWAWVQRCLEKGSSAGGGSASLQPLLSHVLAQPPCIQRTVGVLVNQFTNILAVCCPLGKLGFGPDTNQVFPQLT
jgi:hypothetical protein